MAGKSTNYFLGGNTSIGFFSHFDYIISQEEATRIISLKGGPGTGKSSLMKKIGKYYLSKGYNVEFHHCSSDDNSLDGVLIKELKVALLDGTAPHIIDPVNPGAVDEIINMANCLDNEGLKNFKTQILDTNTEIDNTFKRAYRYFGAARNLYDDWSILNSEVLNSYELNILKENLKNEILPYDLSSLGKKRHLFATGFTPNGIVTYINSIIEHIDNIYVLKGSPGTFKSNVLEYIAEEATRRGFNVEVLHTPLVPDKIEHLIIPDLKVAIVTSNKITNLNFNGKMYDMDTLLNEDLLAKNNDAILESSTLFYTLLSKGLNCITHAKNLHDKLESFYIPSMDFKKADAIYEEIIQRINAY